MSRVTSIKKAVTSMETARDWNCTPDILYTELAQLEERGPYKAEVMGSSPLLCTICETHQRPIQQLLL